MVRELGSERRETVWSLSAVKLKRVRDSPLVREDCGESVTGRRIVINLACEKATPR